MERGCHVPAWWVFLLSSPAAPVLTAITPAANRFQSRKYPQLNPILAADQTLLRYDVRVRPKDTIQSSTYYSNAAIAALADTNVTHLRLVSKAFPWTIEVKAPMGNIITCEGVWDAIYFALQEPLADSEWGMVVGAMGNAEKARREAILKAAGKREAKDGEKRLKRIDWLGDSTFFKGLEKDEDYEKARLLPKAQPCAETWVLRLS